MRTHIDEHGLIAKLSLFYHGIKAGSFDNDGHFHPVVKHARVWPKMPHVRGRVKVSHIAKRSLSCRLYKLWTPLLSQGVF